MKKRILICLIVALMLFSNSAVFAAPLQLDKKVVTDELETVLDVSEDNDYISIYIWLKEYDDELIYSLLSKQFSTSITKDNEELFIKDLVEEKIKDIKEQSMLNNLNYDNLSVTIDILMNDDDISSAMSVKEIEKCEETGMKLEEIIELSLRTKFISIWREVRKILNTFKNEQFALKLEKPECKNVNISSLFTYIELECKKSYISKLSECIEVNEIGYRVLEDETEMVYDYTTESSNDDGIGYHMTKKEGINYDAAGIKIGVLECMEKGTNGFAYDTLNPHLAGKESQGLLTSKYFGYSESNTAIISKHATTVLSIICGNSVLMSDSTLNYYQGIAPNATVFYANFKGEEFENALSWLLCEKDVSVINMSFSYLKKSGVEYLYHYWEADKIVDKCIREYRVSIVVAAGNKDLTYDINNVQRNPDNKVLSPGLAYNSITVANIDYNDYEYGKYGINNSSSYVLQDEYLTNKPDISAFGTRIYILNQNYEPENRGSGTSFSAPMVTGTIALMLKENPTLIGLPDRTKSILLASADESAIETENNELRFQALTNQYVIANGITRKKSGAGLLNIPATLNKTTNSVCWSYSVSNLTSGLSFGSQTFYIPSYRVIRVGCVYENAKDNLITSVYEVDINIRIINMSGIVVFDSKNMISNTLNNRNDNVELFDILLKSSGEYRFEIYVDSCEAMPEKLNVTLIVNCACSNPNSFVENINKIATRRECNNCGFAMIESYDEITSSDNFEMGNLIYYLKYNYIYQNGERIIYETDFTVECNTYDTTKKAILTLNDIAVSNLSTGYIETREYMIVVNNSDNTYCATYYLEISVEYDSFTKVFEFVN